MRVGPKMIAATVAAVVLSMGCALSPVGAVELLTAPSVNDECAAILATVEAAHLYLPGEFAFRCPFDPDTAQHLGATVWNGTRGWVALNLANVRSFGASPEFTLAHETCHAWEYDATGATTEDAADACAAAHGFSYFGGQG